MGSLPKKKGCSDKRKGEEIYVLERLTMLSTLEDDEETSTVKKPITPIFEEFPAVPPPKLHFH